MKLKARRPSPNTIEAMKDAVNDLASYSHHHNYKYKTEEAINKITGHEEARILNSGNASIIAAMSTMKGPIMVPDQGGWSGFIKTANFFNLEVIKIETSNGLLDPSKLNDELKKNDVESLFLTSFAGYMAEQPIVDIYEVCKEFGVLLVQDASGALGDKSGKLVNSKYSDIILASTGSPKMVNVGSGGFITSNDPEKLGDPQLLKMLQANSIICAGINEEINQAHQNFSRTIEACNFLKKDIKCFHRTKRGVNICIPIDNPKFIAKRFRSYFQVEGGGMISACPRYDRINENAVCLEIKNLDISCLTNSTLRSMLYIIQQILEEIEV